MSGGKAYSSMDKLRQAVRLEFELIAETLAQLPDPGKLESLSRLEVLGTAKCLSDVYMGFENTIKRIAQSRGLQLPTGPSWHRDLLRFAIDNHFISQSTGDLMVSLLGFRHFSAHAYGMRLSPERFGPVVRLAPGAFESFKEDIERLL